MLLTFFFLISFNSFSSKTIGKVTRVKGDASLLYLGDTEARKIIKGMNIKKDTSVLTEKKSFVQITMNDKSKIILGPKSKMIINKTPKEKTGIVNLMMGKIRSEVTKKGKSKDKLFIQTRTAALGVRGTDFQTLYNPQNKITSLVTFNGEVALVKSKMADKIDPSKLKKELDKSSSVLVKKGRYSSVSTNLNKATIPIKISPIQFTRLKINKEMQNEPLKENENKFQKELATTLKEYEIISNKELKKNLLAKRAYDVKKGSLRPTAGGIIDLETGIYVPPTMKKENYNKKLNIYKLSNKKGQITKSGSYTPPKGIKLDATKGFVAIAKESEESVSKLNQEIKGQLVRPKKPTLEDLEQESEDSYEKYFIIQ